MNEILYLQFLGVLGGLVMHLVFYSISRKIGKDWWPVYYILILAATGSLLSLHAIQDIPYFTRVIAAVLISAAVLNPPRLNMSLSKFKPSLIWGVWVLLFLDFWWAGFPTYRYDQWNYHLPISKIIDSVGFLPLPYFDDHKYFTGGYEYIFLMLRLFTKNDFLVQTTSNAFTWLVYVCLLWGNLKLLLKGVQKTWVPPVILLSFMLFAAPEHEALYNSKPNLLLTPVCLSLIVMLKKYFEHRTINWMLFGCLAFSPLAFKVTWLHLGVALTGSLAFFWWRGHIKPDIKRLLLGAGVGFLIVLPFFIKNHFFFGNSLHPGQLPLFHSDRWLASNAYHWLRDSNKATDLLSYFTILLFIPMTFAKIIGWYLAPLPLLLHKHTRKSSAPRSLIYLFCAALTLGYFLVWPFLFDPRHQPRYADPIYAAVIVVVLGLLWSAPKRWYTVALFCAPLLLNSSLDVKLRKMGEGYAAGSIANYYQADVRPYNIYHVTKIINDHRRATFPSASPTKHITMSDTPALYLLDSLNLRLDYYGHEWLYGEFQASTGTNCIWGYLKKFHVNYIYLHIKNWKEIPREFWAINNKDLVVLDKDKQIFYLPEETIDQRIAFEDNCQKSASKL